MSSLVFGPPDQNPLEAGKRVEASGKIEEPGLGGNGQEAKVGGPRDGGEGGDRHARHLQLPREQWEHQKLAPVVEQPEVGLGIEMDFYQETKLKNLEIKQSIGSPVKDLCCPKYHEDILPNPRRLLRVTFYQVQDKE